MFIDLNSASMTDSLFPMCNSKVRVLDNHNTSTIRFASVSINFSLIYKTFINLHPLFENSRRMVSVIRRTFSGYNKFLHEVHAIYSLVESFSFNHSSSRFFNSSHDIIIWSKRTSFVLLLGRLSLRNCDRFRSSLFLALLLVISLRRRILHFLTFFHHAIAILEFKMATFFHSQEILVAIVVNVFRLLT